MMRGLKQFLNDDLCGEVANLFIFAWLVSFAASLTITVINSILQVHSSFIPLVFDATLYKKKVMAGTY